MQINNNGKYIITQKIAIENIKIAERTKGTSSVLFYKTFWQRGSRRLACLDSFVDNKLTTFKVSVERNNYQSAGSRSRNKYGRRKTRPEYTHDELCSPDAK